jgi:hypothetical protein
MFIWEKAVRLAVRTYAASKGFPDPTDAELDTLIEDPISLVVQLWEDDAMRESRKRLRSVPDDDLPWLDEAD